MSVPYQDRRLSFGAAADAYNRYRPGYPVAAVEWILAPLGRPPAERQVVDLGAGTGALTRVIEGTGAQTVAVEPDDGMRAVLTLALPGVAAHAGSAESLPLADASVDAVVVGQAWHWFDPAAAVPEIVRVLRPGGVLGLVWNLRDDDVPWMAAMSDIVGGEDTLRASRDGGNVRAALEPRFGPVEAERFPHSVTHTVDTLVGLVGTFSYVRLSPDRDAILAAVRELATTHPELAGRDSFELPYVTSAFRAVPR